MNANVWKPKLHRLLELFERESTISLKEIKRCFDASGLPFDEEFRKYFLKVSTVRLDTSFDAVLFDQLIENRMPMVRNVGAPIDNAQVEEHDDAPNVTKMENNADDPIEIADTDDEGHEEQRIQKENNLIGDGQMEANVLQRFNNGDENRDGECNGSADVNDGNGIEVDVKHEVKVEIEHEMEMEDLPIVEFDPNKATDDTIVQNDIAEIAMMNNRRQSSSSSNVQNQSKHDADKRFKCTDCAYTTDRKYHFKQHLQIHTSIKPFKCTHCDFACRRKPHLKRHQSVHAQGKLLGVVRDPNDGLYKCTHCDQRFMEIRFLSTHLTKSHKNNQRLFNCVHCLRRFVQKAEKDRHEIRCANRHYECYLCKKYITRDLTNMQDHMRTHSGEKPFECAICHQCFQQKGNLGCHLDAVHGRKHK